MSQNDLFPFKLRLTLFNLYGKAKVATNNKANMANILDILFNLFFEICIKILFKILFKIFFNFYKIFVQIKLKNKILFLYMFKILKI